MTTTSFSGTCHYIFIWRHVTGGWCEKLFPSVMTTHFDPSTGMAGQLVGGFRKENNKAETDAKKKKQSSARLEPAPEVLHLRETSFLEYFRFLSLCTWGPRSSGMLHTLRVVTRWKQHCPFFRKETVDTANSSAYENKFHSANPPL